MYFRKLFILIPAVILLLLSAGCAEDGGKPEEISTRDPELPSAAAEEINGINEINEANEPDDSGNPGGGEFDGVTVFENGFAFAYNGADIYMGEYIDNILPLLGPEPEPYYQDSCTSEGMMVTYAYGGFEISAYAKNEGDDYRIFSITVYDDSVATPEGIYIGQSVDDMIAAYGEDYEENAEMPDYYKYSKNGTALSFDADGGAIIFITYQLLVVA